jgi:hypothetical protein
MYAACEACNNTVSATKWPDGCGVKCFEFAGDQF